MSTFTLRLVFLIFLALKKIWTLNSPSYHRYPHVWHSETVRCPYVPEDFVAIVVPVVDFALILQDFVVTVELTRDSVRVFDWEANSRGLEKDEKVTVTPSSTFDSPVTNFPRHSVVVDSVVCAEASVDFLVPLKTRLSLPSLWPFL